MDQGIERARRLIGENGVGEGANNLGEPVAGVFEEDWEVATDEADEEEAGGSGKVGSEKGVDKERVGSGSKVEAAAFGGEREEAEGRAGLDRRPEIEEKSVEAVGGEAGEGLAAEGGVDGWAGEEKGEVAAEERGVVGGGGGSARWRRGVVVRLRGGGAGEG